MTASPSLSTTQPPQPPLGLIAGQGVFPFLVARGARAQGRQVVCAALSGNADPLLAGEVDVFRPVGTLRLGQWIRVLRSAGVREAIMVGRVGKSQMYSRTRWLTYVPDFRTIRIYFTRLRHDKRDQAVLHAVADELAREGITLIDSTTFCKDQMATPGVMTRRQPTPGQLLDAEFGFPLCKMVSSADIGQAMAVVDKDVIAVEAVEGTDRMIDRAGQWCKGRSWTLIKVANAHRDLRVDVPSVGTATIEKLKSAGCGCLVLEVGQTMMLDKPKIIELADKYGIAIVGR
jgi:DUF1009 family protein